jgi:hypothetical protein
LNVPFFLHILNETSASITVPAKTAAEETTVDDMVKTKIRCVFSEMIFPKGRS